jgi:hypothetical protein
MYRERSEWFGNRERNVIKCNMFLFCQMDSYDEGEYLEIVDFDEELQRLCDRMSNEKGIILKASDYMEMPEFPKTLIQAMDRANTVPGKWD